MKGGDSVQERDQLVQLIGQEWTVDIRDTDFRERRWRLRVEGIGSKYIWSVCVFVVRAHCMVFKSFPVNAKGLRVVDGLRSDVETALPILDGAEEEHVAWASLAFPIDTDLVMIPGFRPFKDLLVDCLKEEKMEQPNMRVDVRVKVGRALQVLQEPLPLRTQSRREIDPQPLDADVVDAPEHFNSQHMEH